MSSSSAIVVVMHATSKQGTSVVNSLLDTHKFTVKALTRDAGSDSALCCASCAHPAHPWPCSSAWLHTQLFRTT